MESPMIFRLFQLARALGRDGQPGTDATAMAPEVAGEAMASPESGAGNHGKWWFHHGQWCDFTRENGDLTIEIGDLTKGNMVITREQV